MNSQGSVKSGLITTSSSDENALATSRFQMLPMLWKMLGFSLGGMRPDAVWRDVDVLLVTVGAVEDGPTKADAPRGATRRVRMDDSFMLWWGSERGWQCVQWIGSGSGGRSSNAKRKGRFGVLAVCLASSL